MSPCDSPLGNFSDYEFNEDYDDHDHSDISDVSSEDSREIASTRKALQLDPTQLSSRPGGLPVNGHDFLKLVQEERDKLPEILSVKKPPPPAAPSKVRDQNESQVGFKFERDDFERRAGNCSKDVTLLEQSLACSSSSSEQMFSPNCSEESSPGKTFGMKPLPNDSIYLSNTSLDKICDKSLPGDVSMTVSETGIGNCSIASSSVFREKVKLRKSLGNGSNRDGSPTKE